MPVAWDIIGWLGWNPVGCGAWNPVGCDDRNDGCNGGFWKGEALLLGLVGIKLLKPV